MIKLLSRHIPTTMRAFWVCFTLFLFALMLLLLNTSLDATTLAKFTAGDEIWQLVMFIFIYAASIVFFIPSLPLNVLAGFLWGTFQGGLIVALTATLGGTIAFTLAKKTIGRKLWNRVRHRLPTPVFKMLQKHGLASVVLIRLNPIFPTSVVNYALATTNITFPIFIATTFLPLLIPSLFIASIGASLDEFSFEKENFGIEMNDLFVLSALASTTFIGAYGSYLLLKKENK